MAAAPRKPILELTPAQASARERSRKLLSRRALVAAAAGAVPVPGLDWAVDAALLSKLLPQISQEFGLSPTQISHLPPKQRERVQSAITVIGGTLVGKLITKELIIIAAKAVGLRLTAAQAAKYVPIAGTLLSAGLNYTAVRWLGEQHIKDCLSVVQQAQLILPAPKPSA
jgi:uncharacterized protein (DUF697 family)